MARVISIMSLGLSMSVLTEAQVADVFVPEVDATELKLPHQMDQQAMFSVTERYLNRALTQSEMQQLSAFCENLKRNPQIN